MGNQQSAEKPASSKSPQPHVDRERKDLHRRRSIGALSHARAGPADPSASTTNAVAQVTTSHNIEKHSLQQILDSTASEPPVDHLKHEQSESQVVKDKKETEQKPIPIRSHPMSVPEAPGTGHSGHIDIPAASTVSWPRQEEPVKDSQVYEERPYAPLSFHRPPRLPLPIADAPTPDSPALHPIDVSNNDIPIFDTDEPISAVDPSMRRRSSFQSEATQEDDEVAEELQPYAVTQPSHTVPTTVEWNQPGERVFVTGTFATWEKKYRLHRRKVGRGMYCVINLPPGTHHLKFFVDNQMVTSNDLPTAVDFNNVLVNYIEISADDIPNRRESSAGTKITSMPTGEQDHPQDATTPGAEEVETKDGTFKIEMPAGDFRSIIPQYLTDIDYPDDDPRYQRAVSVISDSSAPPSLPMFLNKSLLNGLLPVKDDSSVLTLPNHTVLNHLMTSSVKNGVLATSATTRYKAKYVTTISFKPVPKIDRQ